MILSLQDIFYCSTPICKDFSSFDLDSFRETEEEVPQEAVATTYGLITTPQYGDPTLYDTPAEALKNYGEMFKEVSAQQEQTASVYNYNNYDPGYFARAGFSGVKGPQEVAGGNKVLKS